MTKLLGALVDLPPIPDLERFEAVEVIRRLRRLDFFFFDEEDDDGEESGGERVGVLTGARSSIPSPNAPRSDSSVG